MNYIRELNAFRDWSMLNNPSTGEVALWYSLISVNNAAGWVEWFTTANQTLQLMTGLSRQGLDKSRNRLMQRGLIEYRKGTSNQAGKYRMVSLECQKVGTSVVTSVGTAGAFQWSHEERRGSHTGSTLLNINETETKDTQRDTAFRELVQAYEQVCGPLKGEPSQLYLLYDYVDKGMDMSLVITALRKSSTADYPARYADSILRGWQRKGYKTVDEAVAADTPKKQRTSSEQRASHQVKPETQAANADERYANFFKKYPGGADGGPRNDTG